MQSSNENEWCLVPRIRLDFTLTSTGPDIDVGAGLRHHAKSFFLFGKPVEILKSDIHMEAMAMDDVPQRQRQRRSPLEYLVNGPRKGRGIIYFRDLNFIDRGREWEKGDDSQKKLQRGRQFLISKLSPFESSSSQIGSTCKLFAHTPVHEDPQKMKSIIGTAQTPTILLKGLPPDFPVSFFRTIAHVRDLTMTRHYVSIQFESYEECNKALDNLCSFSLQHKESGKILDYQLTCPDSWLQISPIFADSSNSDTDQWALLPRILLNFDLTWSPLTVMSPEAFFWFIMTQVATSRMCGCLSLSDIRIDITNQASRSARGTMFFRDLSFIEEDGLEKTENPEELHKKLRKGREIILDYFSHLKFEDNGQLSRFPFGGNCKLSAYIPDSELPHKMQSVIRQTHVEQQQQHPTIHLKGFPSQWVAHFTSSSKKNLRSFFYTLADVRDLTMIGDNVSIQFESYQECYKALDNLCSFSLQHKATGEIADYEVIVYDALVSDRLAKKPRFQSIASKNRESAHPITGFK